MNLDLIKLEKKVQFSFTIGNFQPSVHHTHSYRIAVLKLDEKVQVLMREKSDSVEERSSQDRHIQEQVRQTELLQL